MGGIPSAILSGGGKLSPVGGIPSAILSGGGKLSPVGGGGGGGVGEIKPVNGNIEGNFKKMEYTLFH